MSLTTLIAATLLHGSPMPGGPTPVLARAETSAETAEGAEILRRLLVEALDHAFDQKQDQKQEESALLQGRKWNGLVTNLWAGEHTIQLSRAFHMPEVGLFFALDAALPVATEEKQVGAAGSDQPTDDEWERIRREVRGDLAPDATGLRRLRIVGRSSPMQIDPKAIEQVIDLVLETVARHAVRIEGLAPKETVTVALRLSGQSRSWLHDSGAAGLGFAFDSNGEVATAEPDSRAFSAYILATGHEVREQNLVIRIALGDLAGFADGAAGARERLRSRAQVNRY